MPIFVSQFAGNLRVQYHNKAQKNQAILTDIQYFCVYQQVLLTLTFILYPLFILLPNYLYQLPLYTRYIGRDTDTVTVIAIAITTTCLF